MGSCCRSFEGRCQVLGVGCQESVVVGFGKRSSRSLVLGRWQNLQTDAAVESHVSKTAKRGAPAIEGTGLAGVGDGLLLKCPSVTSETVATTGRPAPSVIFSRHGGWPPFAEFSTLGIRGRGNRDGVRFVDLLCASRAWPVFGGARSHDRAAFVAEQTAVGALHLVGGAWGVEDTSRARSKFQVVPSRGIAFRR